MKKIGDVPLTEKRRCPTVKSDDLVLLLIGIFLPDLRKLSTPSQVVMRSWLVHKHARRPASHEVVQHALGIFFCEEEEMGRSKKEGHTEDRTTHKS